MMTTTPSQLPKAKIEEIAEQFALEVGYDPGSDLVSLVESWGHTVRIAEGDVPAESLHIDANGRMEIVVPTYTSRARDCFTIAHEIGHFVLHHEKGGPPERYNRSGGDLAEVEANWFAAAFLMPADAFITAALKSPLFRVASKFGVSESAAEVRAKSLGISSPQ